MPQKSTTKSLVIVESPAKAKTIGRFLGPGYTVEASIGHIRDLAKAKKELPEELRKEDWAYLAVNVRNNFEPVYVVSAERKTQVAKLRKLLKEVDDLYLATDEDREGEAISWHLVETLKPKVPVRRLVFHEITQEAITEALASPRQIDERLVRAQETRRILDRLYGYDVSQLVWKKVKPGLSAGRVQSVAVRKIVERERARRAFVSAEYWDLLGNFAKETGQSLQATLVRVNDRPIPSGKDFDSATGQLKPGAFTLLNEQGAQELAERLQSADFRVLKVEEKPYTSRPAPPFTTSTLQQEANRKLSFGSRRTMQVAQALYENGYITYMRTDSTSLAKVAVDAARDLVQSEYGPQYLPDQPRIYASKVKNAQEAHEAIRPAGHPFRIPAALKSELSNEQFRLFELIWKRTVASQMKDARGRRITIQIEGDGAVFQVSGKTIDFPGYLRAYVEGSDDPQAELADQETILPAVTVQEALKCLKLEPKGHATQPPSRFSEASLVKELESDGIGRPSTYSSIIETIIERTYVFRRGSALAPTWTGFAVVKLLEDHFGRLVDYQFTAEMEDYLDSISRGEAEHLTYLKQFYFGNGNPGLKPQLESKAESIDPQDIKSFPVALPGETMPEPPIYLRVGVRGPYLEQGDRKANVPEDLPPDEMSVVKALELLDAAQKGEEPLGIYKDTRKEVYVKQGRFGPYVQLLDPGDPESKPKNASLVQGMTVHDVDLDIATRLLELPKTIGQHPETGEDVVVNNGRYGMYVQSGKETRSLPNELAAVDTSLEEAVRLLKEPKRGRGRAASKPPIKTFDESPVTGKPVNLLEGRYGPYVSDGETNASIPKGTDPQEVTFKQALELLAERAAAAPKKKKTAKKSTKKAAAKKTTKKKTAKKSAKKSS